MFIVREIAGVNQGGKFEQSDQFISECCHIMTTFVSLSNFAIPGTGITNTLLLKISCVEIFPLFNCKMHKVYKTICTV